MHGEDYDGNKEVLRRWVSTTSFAGAISSVERLAASDETLRKHERDQERRLLYGDIRQASKL